MPESDDYISVSVSTTVLNPRLTQTGHDGIRKDHPRGCCPSSAEMDRIVEVAVHFELCGPLDVYEKLRMRVNDYPLARPAVYVYIILEIRTRIASRLPVQPT